MGHTTYKKSTTLRANSYSEAGIKKESWNRDMNGSGILFGMIAAIFVILGAYLMFKPQDYKNEMTGLGHLFGEFSPLAIRILGAVLVATAVCLSYLFVTSSR